MLKRRHRHRALRALLAMIVMSVGLVVFGPASPAGADPVCQSGGAYVLFARGSGSDFDSVQATAFRSTITGALHAKGFNDVAWAELGNVDGSVQPSAGRGPDDPVHEYPAVHVDGTNVVNMVNGQYNSSVTIGKNELVAHLNDRYAGDGPRNNGGCTQETLVLGGYSQGADVVGWALQSGLSQAAKDHIGFVALYGDPKFNPGPLWDRVLNINFQNDWWWVRGNAPGFFVAPPSPATGFLGARDPYVFNEFKGRFGSWCTDFDAFCANWLPFGLDVHTHSYSDTWIPNSADEIAYVAKQKRDRLVQGTTSNAGIGTYVTTPPQAAAPQQRPSGSSAVNAPPIITQLKRTLGPDGARQVYASTLSTVTEAYWFQGGDGVHTHKIIDIAQDNIVGFDKTNLPEGKQAVYTAVPDGVWESTWQAGVEVHQAKIITGLSGVRQVIADNRQESAGYTHRLYVLASDGPHEYWWRDGGDGIHHDELLNSIAGAVTMVSGTGPDGAYELFAATPTWVYQLYWFPGGSVNHRTIINVTQGDIRSLSMGDNINGGQLLYVGTATTAWQCWWPGTSGGAATGTIATGQTNAIQVKKTVINTVHELYLATNDHVQEYWWDGPNSGGGELIRISQGNITAIDKVNDGNYQQLYVGTGNGDVWETYWGGGQGITSKVLFSVSR